MHRSFNAALMIIVTILTLALTWMMDGNQKSGKSPTAIKPEKASLETAPDAALTGMDGKQTRLYAYKGKVILLNFWASWCAPCIAEFPQFINLARALPDDIVILAVSIDDERSNIEKFLKKHMPDYAVIPNLKIFHDRDKSVSQDLFQTVRVPETIIITPEMKMARKIAGMGIEWDSSETRNYLSGLRTP